MDTTPLRQPIALLPLLLALAQPATAQLYGDGSHGVFAPTANTTLSTATNGGVYQFTSIVIPAGVTVSLAGPNPAMLLCTGAVTIAGSLRADAPGSDWVTNGPWTGDRTSGPGGFDGGPDYLPGLGPGGGAPGAGLGNLNAGGCASHATPGALHPIGWPAPPTYGAALPFSLEGGSGGGGSVAPGVAPPASGGGGVIAILAGGSIDVSGVVSARGGDIMMSSMAQIGNVGGNGSGGSILLRSVQCVTITGTVDATGGILGTGGIIWFTGLRGGDGFVRIDSYTACGSPNIANATIRPAPFVAPLPFLTSLDPARVGRTCRLRIASPPSDVLGLYYSFGTVMTPVPPFGVLGLDPGLILMLGQFGVPTTGRDPLAAVGVTVPNVQSLVGVDVYAQAFNAFGPYVAQARFSNLLHLTIVP